MEIGLLVRLVLQHLVALLRPLVSRDLPVWRVCGVVLAVAFSHLEAADDVLLAGPAARG